MGVGVGAAIIAEESLANGHSLTLARFLAQQAPWSDVPLLVLAGHGEVSPTAEEALATFGNITLLDRPVRVTTLVSAIRTALRARQRQYDVRAYLMEQKRAQEARALLAAIVESSADAIVSKTLEGIITSWNHGAECLFGYTSEEAIGQPITIVIPPDRHAEEKRILDHVRRRRVEHFETVRMKKSGERFDISLTVSPILDDQGRVIGASKVARDITPRKKAEAALREADRRKDEFLATLAHELRNPLAPIRNSLSILRLTTHNDWTIDRLTETMERQVNHMVRLVDDLMEVSRITRGKIDLRKEVVDLATVIRNAIETSRPLIDSSGHRLAVSVPTEPLLLEGDPVRLAQVFGNLLNNAAKYTESGGQIWLTARREGDNACVVVKDNGSGMPSEVLPRIFDMFMQVDGSTGRSQGGLGIGLTLVKRLVEMHGGTVEARSDGLGRGSEFAVRLRLAANARPESLNSGATPHQVLSPRRILVIDDNRDAADSLALLLRMLGANVQAVYSGRDGLEAVRQSHPAVVLLDIGMPEMDGYEVARCIRRESDGHQITLIALSGWGQEEDRRRSAAAGFDHHLIKPADLKVLEDLLAGLGGQRGG
jgi:PAS domain S-box-containing protein